MKLEVIHLQMTVCKVSDVSQIYMNQEFVFVGKTDSELSLVCPTSKVPLNTLAREDGWRMFRIQGQLEFSLIGILSRISRILADNHIGIFVISTFDTDYILTKEANFDRAISLLGDNGYEVV